MRNKMDDSSYFIEQKIETEDHVMLIGLNKRSNLKKLTSNIKHKSKYLYIILERSSLAIQSPNKRGSGMAAIPKNAIKQLFIFPAMI